MADCATWESVGYAVRRGPRRVDLSSSGAETHLIRCALVRRSRRCAPIRAIPRRWRAAAPRPLRRCRGCRTPFSCSWALCKPNISSGAPAASHGISVLWLVPRSGRPARRHTARGRPKRRLSGRCRWPTRSVQVSRAPRPHTFAATHCFPSAAAEVCTACACTLWRRLHLLHALCTHHVCVCCLWHFFR